ncbi:MAG: GTPase Era [Bacilli bacterium]|nr:GTPase Era [Bacilli bacterium]
MKSGFVSILGKSNVGKSTLLNNILHAKISIVTDKQQTTRNAIKGIYNDEDSQIVFIDTPGVHKARQKLGEEMNNMAFQSIKDAEVVIIVIDASYGVDDEVKRIYQKVNRKHIPVITVLNKIDLIKIDRSLRLKDEIADLSDGPIIEMVAKDGFNVDELIKTIKSMLPEGPQYYDKDTISDMDVVFQIKEIIREKALNQLKDEVPHSLAVYMKNIDWDKNPMPIYADIIVEKESQKGIVIGKNGQRLKNIGQRARQPIEALLHKHVFLALTVKVSEDWRNSDSLLSSLGYKTKY